MKHTEIASELFSKRYYCSQAVLAAFAEELGMTKEQALRVGACFGGGMCKAEVCGACTGALMALGLKYGMCEDGDYDSKQRSNSHGIDMELTQYSKLVSDIPTPDFAISMGCDVGCPFIGRPFDDDWGLPAPTGKDDAEFERVIALIEENVLKLVHHISEL